MSEEMVIQNGDYYASIDVDKEGNIMGVIAEIKDGVMIILEVVKKVLE